MKHTISSPKDDRKIQQFKEVYEKYTNEKYLYQMHHPSRTQMNESLNMRLPKEVPKHKHFSNSPSL